MLNKKMVLDALINYQEEKLKELLQYLEEAKKDVVDAPGSNVSHSDTMKFQHGNLVLGLTKRINNVRLCISLLKGQRTFLCEKDKVEVGALFSLKDVNQGNENYYFIVETGGGETIVFKEKEVMMISASAPIAQIVWNKRKGMVVNFRNMLLEIMWVV